VSLQILLTLYLMSKAFSQKKSTSFFPAISCDAADVLVCPTSDVIFRLWAVRKNNTIEALTLAARPKKAATCDP